MQDGDYKSWWWRTFDRGILRAFTLLSAIRTAVEVWTRREAVYIWRNGLWNKGFWTFAATITIAIATTLYTVYAKKQLKALSDQLPELRKSATAAESAALSASREFELSERPWVDAQFATDGPFEFNVNGANIHLRIQGLNSGHTPALGTQIRTLPVDTFGTGHDAAEYRDQVCQDVSFAINRYPSAGVALFPNRPFEWRETVTISQEEISKTHSETAVLGANRGQIVFPAVVVCIGYRPNFDEKIIYHTSYVWDLMHVDNTGRASVNFKIGEDIPRERMRLQIHFMNPITAN